MYGEGLPDIPHQEHPEREWLKKESEKRVADKVAELEIGLDLEKHPKIRERLAEIGSHFEDSVDMAKMIRTVYTELAEKLDLKEEDRNRMMRAAVLHDIGKSGPPGQQTEFHDAVRKLFVPPSKPFNVMDNGRAKTINDFLAEHDFGDNAQIKADLEKNGIETDKESMIDFWRRHAGWTYEILKEDPGTDVDADLIQVAATHHVLENQNPAHLDLENAPPETRKLLEQTELIAAVDKYQAFRARGGMDHDKTIAMLHKISAARPPDLPQELRDKFNAVIDILDKSKGSLEQYFEKK